MLKRLFPSAYPQDTAAASDFRRFTERDLRAQKVADAQVVLDRLDATALGAHDLKIPRDEVEAWLRTLTSVRLAVATRLGITDAETAERLADLPEDDPRSFLVSVYDWLGFAQETMVNATLCRVARETRKEGIDRWRSTRSTRRRLLAAAS